ncbi:hypothetical protein T310_0297 [Rasamsonia emersonii CBS 393.64]|uniref:Uncharacterized protein n=1 Tax=Rasamsonia emersonii (strain ATCC 16479 / CBS 393.64 / IMI 116815) TaxID=1408163 RepID=A0A0F4Z583_RASE3|nr:hypothetical protein T310_0297 [Rasamsonia emersonii CBS 393.64]KKA25657.1 hypothetical protein T310_0297 [Rasamsonia emersonii CBS 393.64]
MVGLKKFFNTSPRSGRNDPRGPAAQDLNSSSGSSDVSYAASAASSTPGARSPFSPDLKHAARLDANHHFLGIERQFERLHEQFRSRPLSSISQLRYNSTDAWTTRAPRHVDVIEALFSSHRYRMPSKSLSPTTPYNEDVADRNLQSPPHRTPERNAYSRIVSQIYQEDVADRNIAKSISNASLRSSQSSQKAWKSQPVTGHVPGSESMRRGQRNRELHGTPRTSSSFENLHHTSQSPEDNVGTRSLSRTETTLRPQVSAPNLSGDRGFRRSLVTSASGGSDNSAGNESTDRPEMVHVSPSPGDEQAAKEDAKRTQTRDSARLSPDDTGRDASRPDSSRPASRRKARDLSINVELASSQKPAIKIEHCEAQPQISDHPSIAQNASIAEIVNSPLPAASPSPLTPPPQQSPSYNVEEIMNMFKQAYISTQATSPNPTFETLQDAIIREINSHDAFRRVPVPDQGPPFTPPASQEGFEEEILQPPPGPSRSARNSAERESQFSKLIRKAPSIRRRGKSLSSTNNNPKSQDKTPKRENQSSRAKRRHTYAQPPSADWIRTFQSNDPQTTGPATTRPPDVPAENHHQRPFFKHHLKRKSDPVPPSPGIEGFFET